MSRVGKISQILTLIFLSLALFSCSEGCVEPDQFDAETVTIQANPTADGVTGTYDDVNGGQVAAWHDTGLRSNGDKFVILISGAWSPWGAEAASSSPLPNMPNCNFCAKRVAGFGAAASANCLCYPGKTPAVEESPSGQPATTASVCQTTEGQNNPNLCTCTNDPTQGRYSDFNVYYFPLNIYDKNEIEKIADETSTCRYDRGMGLYLGLFGFNGATVPKRAYHLFATEEICNINRRTDGKCIDDAGNDRTLYVYRSANNKIFMKDDGAQNRGVDTDTGNDQYHAPNEIIKLIINDRYYSDNYGQYTVSFLRGVGNNGDKGLLEFLVSLVEDTLLGPVNRDGVREGGVVEYMYKAITQDSSFMLSLQILLSLYISIYGLATLLGIAELNKKELLMRLVKIGLILLFTRFESWNMYNELVVRFFKDGMDYVISIMMDLSDSQLEANSMIKTSQLDRATSYSNATRFSYVDVMIKKLMSDGVAKKVFGLFFGTVFGVIYIPIIYFLIAFFIYVMLFVAMIYLVNVVKLIFVLALGPVFILFSLFSHTENMFKNWVSFLGARSLEIIFVFTILYNFLVLIDRNFTDLLSYRTCVHSYPIIPKLIYIKILKSEISYSARSLFQWISSFLVIGGLIYITKLVVEKVGDISGHLISIGGVDNKDSDDNARGSGGFALAANMAGGIKGLTSSVAAKMAGAAAGAGSLGLRGATSVARSTGLADKWNNTIGKIPGPRSMIRNAMINSAIKAAKAGAASQGLKGKDADEYVRKATVQNLQSKMFHDPKKMQLAGMDMKNIGEQLEKKLVKDALKTFIKEEAAAMKAGSGAGIKLGKEARKELRVRVRARADRELVGGRAAVDAYLGKGKDSAEGLSKVRSQQGDKSIKSLIRSETELTSSQVAEKFAHSEEKQKEYQKFLDEKQYREHKLDQRAARGTYWAEAGRNIMKGIRTLGRGTEHNVAMTRENVARKLAYQKQKGDGMLDGAGINTGKGWGVVSRVNVLDKLGKKMGKKFGSDEASKTVGFERDAAAAHRQSLVDRFASDRSMSKERREFFAAQLKGLARDDMKQRIGAAQRSVGRVVKAGEDDLKRLNGEHQSRVSQIDKREKEALKKVERDYAGGSMKQAAETTRIKLDSDKQREISEAELKARSEKSRQDTANAVDRETREQREKLLNSVLKDKDLTTAERVEKLQALQDPTLGPLAVNTKYFIAKIQEQEAQEALVKADELAKRIPTAAVGTDPEEVAKMVAQVKSDASQQEVYAVKLEQQGLVAKELKVDLFDASVTNALISGSIADVGLKGGSVLLGPETQATANASAAAEAAEKAAKQHQAQLKLKIAKMDKGMLELQVNALQAKGVLSEAETRELNDLSKQMVAADREVTRYEREVTT